VPWAMLFGPVRAGTKCATSKLALRAGVVAGVSAQGVTQRAERLYQPVFWTRRAQNPRFDRVRMLHPLRRDQKLRISGRRNGHIRETRRILSIVRSRSPTLKSARSASTCLEPRIGNPVRCLGNPGRCQAMPWADLLCPFRAGWRTVRLEMFSSLSCAGRGTSGQDLKLI
jgi:hypothetical protein